MTTTTAVMITGSGTPATKSEPMLLSCPLLTERFRPPLTPKSMAETTEAIPRVTMMALPFSTDTAKPFTRPTAKPTASTPKRATTAPCGESQIATTAAALAVAPTERSQNLPRIITNASPVNSAATGATASNTDMRECSAKKLGRTTAPAARSTASATMRNVGPRLVAAVARLAIRLFSSLGGSDGPPGWASSAS